MADRTVRCVGEGGQVWEFDADLPYVQDQLASGRLRLADDTDSGGEGGEDVKPAKRTRARKTTTSDADD